MTTAPVIVAYFCHASLLMTTAAVIVAHSHAGFFHDARTHAETRPKSI
jgi:hypothetical protein